MLTLKKLAEEMQPYHNDICIVHDTNLARLIGVYETDDDLYYKTTLIGGRVVYASAVGHCLSLKGLIPPARYAALESVFTLNNAEPTPTFQVENVSTNEGLS